MSSSSTIKRDAFKKCLERRHTLEYAALRVSRAIAVRPLNGLIGTRTSSSLSVVL